MTWKLQARLQKGSGINENLRILPETACRSPESSRGCHVRFTDLIKYWIQKVFLLLQSESFEIHF